MARKGLRRLILFIFIILGGIYGIKKILFSPIFAIKKIDIEGNISKEKMRILWEKFCKENYLSKTPNIFELNKRALSKVFLSDLRIENIKIKRRFPNRLIIVGRERKPLLWIKENLGVDKKGIVFPIEGTQSLPHLLGFSSKNEGDIINTSSLFSILEMLKTYPYFSRIKEIAIKDKKIFLSIDNLLVCIPQDIEGAHKRLKRLDLIFKEDLSSIKLIDLRYDNVILSPYLEVRR